MTVLSPEPAANLADMEVSLTVSSFHGWRPESIPSRVVSFAPIDYQIVHGIPMAPPQMALEADFVGELKGFSTVLGFADPHTVDTQASFRWFPEDFTTTLWEPDSVAGALLATEHFGASISPFLTETRSWDDVARYESWASAAADRTWTTVYTNDVDTTHPVWSPYGDLDPELLGDYAYWRGSDGLRFNPAVSLEEGAGLAMVWTPTQIISRVSLVMVLVPRTPLGDSSTLLSASDSIHVVLNDDSTIDLLVPGSEVQTVSIAARTKPNEPIVLGLSVSLDGSRQVMMSVVDEQVRSVAVTTRPEDPDLDFEDLTWFVSMFNDARVDILEIDLYLGVADLESMLRLSQIFNRIYGVTMR
jgi:hypothetical protein